MDTYNPIKKKKKCGNSKYYSDQENDMRKGEEFKEENAAEINNWFEASSIVSQYH